MTKKTAPKVTGQGGAGRGQGRKRMLKQPIRTTVSFVCTEDEKARLDKWAEAEQLSRSSYVRRALGFPAVE
jgi:hypothetical protein